MNDPVPSKLTSKQEKALSFIESRIASYGMSPTLRELCEYMGYSAIGSAQDLVTALRRKGFLAVPGKQSARSLMPSRQYQRQSQVNAHEDNTYTIPCLGVVPAGNPLEAIEERVGTLRISIGMFRRPFPPPEQLFSVQAKGDSMIDAGIVSGDWLVVKSQNEADHGTIVVARVDGEATVKRLMKDERGWFLKAENLSFSPIRPRAGQSFEIIGAVLALQRVI